MLLLPPQMRDWLPPDHLVYFLLEVVGELDLSPIDRAYDGSKGGRPPFSLRGRDQVRAEWRLICATGNLLKLFRSGYRPSVA